MKWSLIILLFFLNSTYAKIPYKECRQQINKLSKKWKISGEFKKNANELYYAATSDFGKWLLLKNEKDKIVLSKASQRAIIKIAFNKKDCKRKMRLEKITTPLSEKLGDEDLKRKISGKKGIIYLWSPHMPLSVKGLAEIQKATTKKGLTLIAYKFGDKSNSHPRKKVKRFHQKIDSFELKMRNAHLHYPAVLYFENNKIKNSKKLGYENEEGYLGDIKNIFNI